MLSRELDRRGISPPIDVLPSLSRLMNEGVGEGKTREDHRAVADQLYAALSRGKELRRLVSIVGEGQVAAVLVGEGPFADDLEERLVSQGTRRRSIEETLDLAWLLLADFPTSELKRSKPEIIERYRPSEASRDTEDAR